MHLQELIDLMATKSQNKDLSANRRKSEVMTNKKNHCVPECNIKVNGISLKQVTVFKHFGTLITGIFIW